MLKESTAIGRHYNLLDCSELHNPQALNPGNVRLLPVVVPSRPFLTAKLSKVDLALLRLFWMP